MTDIAVSVRGLGKRYHLGAARERYSTLRDSIHKFTSAPLRRLLRRATAAEATPPFWALKDITFDVKRGEVVGIIGRNGAGKSTLLKILSRITEPTEGEADIHGRVGSLLEVGTGFHPELTGRENVYLNGAILGMRRAEIARKFDEIVAFAEVEKFIDTPVKHYSSGMYMRLAFAVAAHLEPEVLIVDEVLAVGDAQFQKKCLGKMGDVARGGRTVLFVSHDMGAVQSLCASAIRLHTGRICEAGASEWVIDQYLRTRASELRQEVRDRTLGIDLTLERIEVEPLALSTGSSVDTSITLRARADSVITGLCLLIYSAREVRVAIVDLRSPDGPYILMNGQAVTVKRRMNQLPLVEGVYKIGLHLESRTTRVDIDEILNIEIGPSESIRHKVIPYAPRYRGHVEIECDDVSATIA